jgi:hypothetical protein
VRVKIFALLSDSGDVLVNGILGLINNLPVLHNTRIDLGHAARQPGDQM